MNNFETYKGSTEKNRAKLKPNWKPRKFFRQEAHSGRSHDKLEESGALGKSRL